MRGPECVSVPVAMPTESLLQVTRHGLYVPAADLYLDARWAPGTVFVSHAHSDHCSKADRIVCTPETAALHEARRGSREALVVPLDEVVRCGEADIVLHSASHCLGAAMLEVRTADGVLVYTGDYKLRPNPFSPPSRFPSCDEIVMESNFGETRYVFPPDDVLLRQLYDFVDAALSDDATPVVLGYALGKGQEALFHLTGHGYDVMLHGAIANICRLHVELGFPFPGPGTWTRYRRGEVGRRVLLTTPSTRKTAMVQGLPKKRIVHLTGWAFHPGAHNIYKGCDLVLPLSDHADYDDLVRTARESGARKVYTVHGPDTFAGRLRSLGIDAEHLGAHPQELCEDEEGQELAPSPGPAQQSFDLQ